MPRVSDEFLKRLLEQVEQGGDVYIDGDVVVINQDGTTSIALTKREYFEAMRHYEMFELIRQRSMAANETEREPAGQ